MQDYFGAVEVSAPKDAYNFLTGTSDMASDNVGKRPFAVTVSNILDCWPQYGLSEADIIYEIETEGGITRMMALYADIRETPLVGPVRSLRLQLLDAVYQFDPIVTCMGDTVYIAATLSRRSFRLLDGAYVSHSVYKDEERYKSYAVEHCWFSSPLLIYESLPDAKIKPERNIRMDSAFNFAEEDSGAVLHGGDANAVCFDFSGYAEGDFRYDAAAEKYLKRQFGRAQCDAGNNDKQLAFDNVFVLFAPVSGVEGTNFIRYDYAAGGEGVYLSRGRFERITWKKTAFENNFVFTAENGETLKVNRGSSYVAMVRDANKNNLLVDGGPVW